MEFVAGVRWSLLSWDIARLLSHCFSLVVESGTIRKSDAANYSRDVDAWLINSGIMSLSCELLCRCGIEPLPLSGWLAAEGWAWYEVLVAVAASKEACCACGMRSR